MAAVSGHRKLQSRLRALGRISTSAELDQVAIQALEPLADQTRAMAPRPSLRQGVRTRKQAAKSRHQRVYWVGFARGMAMRIAHLVELGTAPHSVARGASRRYGIMQDVPPFHPGTPAEPFFRPAFEAKKDDVVRTYGRLFMAMLARVAGRAG